MRASATMVLALWGASTGCASQYAEGIDPAVVPPSLAADHALFNSRCSRCHTLARPLNARVDSPRYWQLYVSRMRRQPGSGITRDEEPRLVRFLTWYTDYRAGRDGGAR